MKCNIIQRISTIKRFKNKTVFYITDNNLFLVLLTLCLNNKIQQILRLSMIIQFVLLIFRQSRKAFRVYISSYIRKIDYLRLESDDGSSGTPMPCFESIIYLSRPTVVSLEPSIFCSLARVSSLFLSLFHDSPSLLKRTLHGIVRGPCSQFDGTWSPTRS